MNQSIRIIVPKALHLHDIIQAKYTELYRQWRHANPTSQNYPLVKLRQNISNAYGVVRQSFPQSSFKQSTFTPWHDKGLYELYYFHWYFAISFVKDKRGNIRAQIYDAHYEGEHHNDTLTSQPYDESRTTRGKILIKESDIRKMVRECISRILQEDRRKPTLGEYEVVDGFFRSCIAPSLKQFGAYNDIRIYYSPSHTYCLLRRENNGTLFFAEIVDVPELGRNETMFAPRKPSEVPAILLRDAQSLLRKAKNQRTLLS